MSCQALPSVLILLPLISPLSASSNTTSREGCDTGAAVDCLKHSELYQSLPEELRHIECANATKSAQCLESMLLRCSQLGDSDEELHSAILQQVVSFREFECSTGSNLASSFHILTSLVVLYEFLRVINGLR